MDDDVGMNSKKYMKQVSATSARKQPLTVFKDPVLKPCVTRAAFLVFDISLKVSVTYPLVLRLLAIIVYTH